MVVGTQDDLSRSFTRRGLLVAAASVAAYRPSAANAVRRIAVLEWAIAEILLALGIKPFAVVEAPYYRQRVIEPNLPDDVIDLGLRSQPNLALLSRLKPDLIVGLSNYGPSLAMLSPIAPALQFAVYGPERRPFARSLDATATLARRLGQEQAAGSAIFAADQEFAALRQRLPSYDGRPVLIANFADDRRADVFGAGSQFAEALLRLDIRNAYAGPTNSWGFATLGLDVLLRMESVRLVALSPGVPQALRASALWAAMPLVREQRVVTLPPVWVYGAWPSALRFARLLVDALGRAER